MGTEAGLALLARLLLASSAAALLACALRRPLRAWLGARAAYPLWGVVPVSLLAMLLPARPVLVQALPGAGLRLDAGLPVAAAIAAPALASWLVPLWLLGALLWAAALSWRQRRFVRSLGRLERIDAGRLRAEAVDGLPAVVGLLRPRVVLPCDFAARYTPEEQRLVLAHEQVHLRRGDPWANALAALVLCLHWFNPVMHYALRRFRHDQELACDAVVIARAPQARMAYGVAMLKSPMPASAAPMGCQWRPRQFLKERIVLLKRRSPSRRGLLAARLAVAVLVAAAGYAAWAQQPARAIAGPAAPAASRVEQKELKPPRYPAEALRRNQGGQVVVLVDVDAQGRPGAVRVDRSEPEGVFDAATIEAVRQWRFQPATRNGRPVAARVRVPVTFETGMRPVAPPAGHAGDGYAWYRLEPDAMDPRTCDARLADPGAAAGALPLCGLREPVRR